MSVNSTLMSPASPMQNLLQKYTNIHSRFMVVNGQLVHYRDEGTGIPLVCLHGAFSSLHTYNSWAKELMPHYRVVRYDLPGFGLTGANRNDDYSIQMHIDYLDEILDILKIEKCYLVGSSFGGWVAWEYAALRPERVEKLVLIDAAGFLDADSIPMPFMMARMPLVDKVIKIAAQRETIELFLRQVYHNQDKITERLIDRYYDLFARTGNPDAFVRLANQRVKDHTRRLRDIEQPTLVLWGEQDKWLPVRGADRFLRLLPNAEGIIYENVGHIPMEEIPKRTAADLRAFLER
jgi:pimeloyl-ACP methyl ester carboxylesterase